MKKRLLSLTLLALIGSNSFAMQDNFFPSFDNDRAPAAEHRLIKSVAEHSRNSWIAAFFHGFFTPQKGSLYFAPTLLMSLLNVRNATETGTLNNIHECNTSVFSRGHRQITSFTKNSIAFALGSLLRYGINQKLYPKNYWLQWALEPASWFIFTMGSYVHQIEYNRSLQFSYSDVVKAILHKDTYEEHDQLHIEKALSKEAIDPNELWECPIGMVLKKNNQKLLATFIEYYKVFPSSLFSDVPYNKSLNYNNISLFKKFLSLATQFHSKEPIKYGKQFVNAFVNLINNRISMQAQTFSLPEAELAMLELFFEAIKEMGHNPYPQVQYRRSNPIGYWDANPINKNLKIYNTLQTAGTNTSTSLELYGKEKQLLNRVIKHFIQIGMPIYELNIAPEDHLSYYHDLQTKSPYEFAQSNDEIRDFLKLVHRYNKQLVDYKKQDFTDFINNLKTTEGDDIFELAAKRGHINTLRTLEKIDKNNYSRTNAADIAIKLCNTSLLKKYFNNCFIAHDLEKKLQGREKELYLLAKQEYDAQTNTNKERLKEILTKTFDQQKITPEQAEVIHTIFKDTYMRANPQRINQSIMGFRTETQ